MPVSPVALGPGRLAAAVGFALLLASPVRAQMATADSARADSARVDSSGAPAERGRSAVGLVCEFKSGPRVGERQRVGLTGADARVGAPCTDGMGSTGRLVADDVTSTGPTPPDPRRLTTTCQLERGPRAGQLERGIVPTRVGSPCADRQQENFGTAVEEGPTPAARPDKPLGGIPDDTCRARSVAAGITCRSVPGEPPRPPAGSAAGVQRRPPR